MASRKDIIERYELATDGKVIIDVSVQTVEHLYSNFDRTAPYLKKDLEDEFMDYLTESAREIGRLPFVIRISLGQMPGDVVQDRVRNSIRTYCEYLQKVERREILGMYRRALVLFVVGLALMAMAIEARRLPWVEGVLEEVLSQGLTVAAWVSLWTAITNVFLEWHPHRRNFRLYDRIGNAPVMFRVLPQSEQ